MRDFTPRPWQPPMVDFGLAHDRCALLARMGMGKTPAVLSIIEARMFAGTVRKTIVLAPLRVARSTWPEETHKWTQFAGLRVKFIEWTAAEREFLRVLRKADAADLRDPKSEETKALWARVEEFRPAARRSRLAVIAQLDVLCVNYDIVPQLVEILGEAWPFQLVVADEATRVKSFRLRQGGKRAQALARIAHDHTRFWINLTGTFAPNGLSDLWGPMWFIDRGARLGRSYDDFESRWFGFQRAKDALTAHKTRIKRILFPHSFDEIIGRIKDVALAFNPKDWFNIKAPIVQPVYVDLPPDARKRYREMERDLFTRLEGHDIEAFAASAKLIKCLQLANGAVYTGTDAEIESDISHWVEAHDEKLQALESIIEEAQGEPILVAYHFKPDLARLLKRFPQGRHIDTKLDEDDFKAGRVPVAFVHPQSIGHGVDGFQNVCHIIVFFALNYDLETHDQIIERIGPMRQVQAGFDREVMVYQILARGTIDEIVAARLIEKRQLQDETMDSLAHKPEEVLA
jgi:SNF2 family DNA or RNA helicase